MDDYSVESLIDEDGDFIIREHNDKMLYEVWVFDKGERFSIHKYETFLPDDDALIPYLPAWVTVA